MGKQLLDRTANANVDKTMQEPNDGFFTLSANGIDPIEYANTTGSKIRLESYDKTKEAFGKNFVDPDTGIFKKAEFDNFYKEAGEKVNLTNSINYENLRNTEAYRVASASHMDSPTQFALSRLGTAQESVWMQSTAAINKPFTYLPTEQLALKNGGYFRSFDEKTGEWSTKKLTTWDKFTFSRPLTLEYRPTNDGTWEYVWEQQPFNKNQAYDKTIMSIWGAQERYDGTTRFQNFFQGVLEGLVLDTFKTVFEIAGAVNPTNVLHTLKMDDYSKIFSNLYGEDPPTIQKNNDPFLFNTEEINRLKEGGEVIKRYEDYQTGEIKYLPFSYSDVKYMRENEKGDFEYAEQDGGMFEAINNGMINMTNAFHTKQSSEISEFEMNDYKRLWHSGGNIAGNLIPLIFSGGAVAKGILKGGAEVSELVVKNPSIIKKIIKKVIPVSKKTAGVDVLRNISKMTPKNVLAAQRWGRATSTAIGTSQALTQVHSEAKQNGLTDAEAFNVVALSTPMIAITEWMLATPGYINRFIPKKFSMQKIVSANVKSIAQMTEKQVYNTEKKALLKKLTLKNIKHSLRTYGENLPDIVRNLQKYKPARYASTFLRQGTEEGIQENLEDLGYDYVKAIHDTYLADANAIKGMGKFGLDFTDTWIGMPTNIGSKEWKAQVKETFMLSFLMGGILGGNVKTKSMDMSVDALTDFISKDGINGVDDNISKLKEYHKELWKKGFQGRNDKDFNDVLITDDGGTHIVAADNIDGLEGGTLLQNMNDINYQLQIQQIDAIGSMIKSSGIIDNEILQNYFGKESMIKTYWEYFVQKNTVMDSIKDIDTQLKDETISEEDKQALTEKRKVLVEGETEKLKAYEKEWALDRGEITDKTIQKMREAGFQDKQLYATLMQVQREYLEIKTSDKHKESLASLTAEANNFLETKGNSKIAIKFQEAIRKDLFQSKLKRSGLKYQDDIDYGKQNRLMRTLEVLRKENIISTMKAREEARKASKESLKSIGVEIDKILGSKESGLKGKNTGNLTAEDFSVENIDLLEKVVGAITANDSLVKTGINPEDAPYVKALTEQASSLHAVLSEDIDPMSPDFNEKINAVTKLENINKSLGNIGNIEDTYTVEDDAKFIMDLLNFDALSSLEGDFNPSAIKGNEIQAATEVLMGYSLVANSNVINSIMKNGEFSEDEAKFMGKVKYDDLMDMFNTDTVTPSQNAPTSVLEDAGRIINSETMNILQNEVVRLKKVLADFSEKFNEYSNERLKKEKRLRIIKAINEGNVLHEIKFAINGIVKGTSGNTNGEGNKLLASQEIMLKTLASIELENGENLRDKLFANDGLIDDLANSVEKLESLFAKTENEKDALKLDSPEIQETLIDIDEKKTVIENLIYKGYQKLGEVKVTYTENDKVVTSDVDLRVSFFSLMMNAGTVGIVSTTDKANINAFGSLFTRATSNVYNLNKDTDIIINVSELKFDNALVPDVFANNYIEAYLNTIANYDMIEFNEFKQKEAEAIRAKTDERIVDDIWTVEQERAVASLIAFAKGKGNFIGAKSIPSGKPNDLSIVRDLEYVYLFGEENFNGDQTWQQTLSKRILAIGEGGSGKSFMVLPLVIKALSSDTNMDVEFVTSAPGQMQANINDLVTKFSNQAAVDTFEHSKLTSETAIIEIKEKANAHDLVVVVIDEAAKLSKNQKNNLSALNKDNIVILGLGDNTQSSYLSLNEDGKYAYDAVGVEFSLGAFTLPYITTKHRSNNMDQYSLLETLAGVLRRISINDISTILQTSTLSKSSYTIVDNVKEGVEFLSSVEEVKTAFKNETHNNSAIIFETKKEADAFRSGLNNPSLESRVKYVMTDIAGEDVEKEDVNSIQGQSYNRVYIAFEYSDDVGNSNIEKGSFKEMKIKNLITSIGRMSTDKKGKGYLALAPIGGFGNSKQVESLSKIPVATIDDVARIMEVDARAEYIASINPTEIALKGEKVTDTTKKTPSTLTKETSTTNSTVKTPSTKKGGKVDSNLKKYDVVIHKRGHLPYYVVNPTNKDNSEAMDIVGFNSSDQVKTVNKKDYTLRAKTTYWGGLKSNDETGEAPVVINNWYELDADGNAVEYEHSNFPDLLEKQRINSANDLLNLMKVVEKEEVTLPIYKGKDKSGKTFLYGVHGKKVIFVLTSADVLFNSLNVKQVELFDKAKNVGVGERVGSALFRSGDIPEKFINNKPIHKSEKAGNGFDYLKKLQALNGNDFVMFDFNETNGTAQANVYQDRNGNWNQELIITVVDKSTNREIRSEIVNFNNKASKEWFDDRKERALEEINSWLGRYKDTDNFNELFYSLLNEKGSILSEILRQNQRLFTKNVKDANNIWHKELIDNKEIESLFKIKDEKVDFEIENLKELPDPKKRIREYVNNVFDLFESKLDNLYVPTTLEGGIGGASKNVDLEHIQIPFTPMMREVSMKLSTDIIDPSNISVSNTDKKTTNTKRGAAALTPKPEFLKMDDNYKRLKIPGERINLLTREETRSLVGSIVGDNVANIDFMNNVSDIKGFVRGLDMMLSYSVDGNRIEDYKAKHEAMHIILNSLGLAERTKVMNDAERVMTEEEKDYYNNMDNGTVEYICDAFMNKTDFEKNYKKEYRGFKGLLYKLIDFIKGLFRSNVTKNTFDTFLNDVWYGKYQLDINKVEIFENDISSHDEVEYLELSDESLKALEEMKEEEEEYEVVQLLGAFKTAAMLNRAVAFTKSTILNRSNYNFDITKEGISIVEAKASFYNDLKAGAFSELVNTTFAPIVANPELFDILVNRAFKSSNLDKIEVNKGFADLSKLSVDFNRSEIVDAIISNIPFRTYDENGNSTDISGTMKQVNKSVLVDIFMDVLENTNVINEYVDLNSFIRSMEATAEEYRQMSATKGGLVLSEKYNTIKSFLEVFGPRKIDKSNIEDVTLYNLVFNQQGLISAFPKYATNIRNKGINATKVFTSIISSFTYTYTTRVKSNIEKNNNGTIFKREEIGSVDKTGGKLAQTKNAMQGKLIDIEEKGRRGSIINYASLKQTKNAKRGVSIIGQNGNVRITTSSFNEALVQQEDGTFNITGDFNSKTSALTYFMQLLGFKVTIDAVESMISSDVAMGENRTSTMVANMLMANQHFISKRLKTDKYIKTELDSYLKDKEDIENRYIGVQDYMRKFNNQGVGSKSGFPDINASNFYSDISEMITFIDAINTFKYKNQTLNRNGERIPLVKLVSTVDKLMYFDETIKRTSEGKTRKIEKAYNKDLKSQIKQKYQEGVETLNNSPMVITKDNGGLQEEAAILGIEASKNMEGITLISNVLENSAKDTTIKLKGYSIFLESNKKEKSDLTVNNWIETILFGHFLDSIKKGEVLHMVSDNFGGSSYMPIFNVSGLNKSFRYKDNNTVTFDPSRIYHMIKKNFLHARKQQYLSLQKWNTLISLLKETASSKKVATSYPNMEVINELFNDTTIKTDLNSKVNKIKNELNKIQITPELLNLMSRAGMMEGVDFVIEEVAIETEKEGVKKIDFIKRLSLGKDTLMNRVEAGEDIYTYDNYTKLHQAIAKDKENETKSNVDSFMRQIFFNRMFDLSITISRNMKTDQMSLDIDKNFPLDKQKYINDFAVLRELASTEEGAKKGDRSYTYHYNDFFYGALLLQHVLAKEVTHTTLSSTDAAFDSAEKKNKANKFIGTGGITPLLGTPQNAPKKANIINITDVNLGENFTEVLDGQSLYSAIGFKRLSKSYGFTYQDQHSRMKLAGTGLNPITGEFNRFKSSSKMFTQQESEMMPFVKAFEKRMMDVTPEMLGLDSSDNIKLDEEWAEYLEQSEFNTLTEIYDTLTNGISQIPHMEAIDTINQMITDHLEKGIDYTNRYIQSLNPASTIKGAAHNLNYAKLFEGNDSFYNSMPSFFDKSFSPLLDTVDNGNMFSQQSLSSEKTDSKYPKQLNAQMSINNEGNRNSTLVDAIERLDSLITNNEIQKLKEDVNEDPLKLALNNNLTQGNTNYVTEVISHGATIQFGPVANELRTAIGSKVNKAIDGVRMYGGGFEQTSGVFFRSPDRPQGLRMYRFLDNAGNEVEKENASIITPVEVVKNYSQAKKMNINHGETLHDVFDIQIKGKDTINIKDMIMEGSIKFEGEIYSGESIWQNEAVRNYTIDGIIDGLINSEINIKRLAKGKDTFKSLDIHNARKLAAYYKAFSKSLFGVFVRTPTPGTESAARFEQTEIVWDSNNILYIPETLMMIDNADYDGDKRSVYQHEIKVTKEGFPVVLNNPTYKNSKDRIKYRGNSALGNTKLDLFEDYYKDIANYDTFTHVLSTDRLENNEKIQQNMKRLKVHDLSSTILATSSDNLNDKMISRLANALTLGARLMKLKGIDPSFKMELSLQNEIDVDETAISNIAISLQAAVDGVKKDILSFMNLSLDNQNAFVAMVLDGKSLDEIVDIMTNDDKEDPKSLFYYVMKNLGSNHNFNNFNPISFEQSLAYEQGRRSIGGQIPADVKIEAEMVRKYYENGEALSRLSRIFSIYSGKKTGRYFYRNKVKDIEFILGDTLDNFLAQARQTKPKFNTIDDIIYKNVKRFKKEYQEELIKTEDSIRSKIDIPKVVTRFPAIMEYLEAIRTEGILSLQHDFRESKIITKLIEDIIAKQKIGYLTSTQYYEMLDGIEGFMLDQFYTKHGPEILMSFSNIDYLMKEKYDLKDKTQADSFTVGFVDYFRTLKGENIQLTPAITKITESYFFKHISIDEKTNRLRLDAGDVVDPESEINKIQESYENLGHDGDIAAFKQAFEEYSFLAYGTEKNRYSTSVIIGFDKTNVAIRYSNFLSDSVFKDVQDSTTELYKDLESHLIENVLLKKSRALIPNEKGNASKLVTADYSHKWKEYSRFKNPNGKYISDIQTKKTKRVLSTEKAGVTALVFRPSDPVVVSTIHNGGMNIQLELNDVSNLMEGMKVVIAGNSWTVRSIVPEANGYVVSFDERGSVKSLDANNLTETVQREVMTKIVKNYLGFNDNLYVAFKDGKSNSIVTKTNKKGKIGFIVNTRKITSATTLEDFKDIIDEIKGGSYFEFIKQVLHINKNISPNISNEDIIKQNINNKDYKDVTILELLNLTVDGIKYEDKVINIDLTEKIADDINAEIAAEKAKSVTEKKNDTIQKSLENVAIRNSLIPAIDALNNLSIGRNVTDLMTKEQSTIYATRIMNRLKAKFNIDYEIISQEEALKIDKNFGSARGGFDVENNKVYLIEGKFSLDTPFHEVLHPFINKMKKDNPDLYKALTKELNSLKEIKGTDIYDAVKQVQKEYGEDSIDEQLTTVISGIAAGRIEARYNKSFIGKVKEFFQWLWSGLFNKKNRDYGSVAEMPSNLRIKDIVDLMFDETVLDVNNNSIDNILFSKEDVKSDKQQAKYINNVTNSNFSNFMLSDSNTIEDQQFAQESIKARTRNIIFNQMKTGDLGVVKMNNLEDTSLVNKFKLYWETQNPNDKAKLKKSLFDDIERTLVPRYLEQKQKYVDKLKDFINEYKGEESFSKESIEEFFGEETAKYVKVSALRDMIYKLEISSNSRIMSYNDFKNEYPNVYDSDFDFEGLSVVVHSSEVENGKMIMNITPVVLDTYNNFNNSPGRRSNRNIASKFITDKEARSLGLDGLSCNYGNTLKLQMAMLAMDLKLRHPDIKVRKFGLMSVTSNAAKFNEGSMVVAADTFRRLKDIDTFREGLSEKFLKTIDDVNNLDINTWATDYIDILYQSLKSQKNDMLSKGLDSDILDSYITDIDAFKIGELEPHQLIDMLKDRKAYIERLNTNSFNQLYGNEEYKAIIEILAEFEGRPSVKMMDPLMFEKSKNLEKNTPEDITRIKDKFKDLSKLDYNLTSVRSIANPILQNYFVRLLDETTQANGLIRKEIKEEVDPIVKDMMDIQKKKGRYLGGKARGIVVDRGEKIWERLYMIETINTQNTGDNNKLLTVNANLKRIHHDFTDQRTIDALRKGQVDKEEVEIGARIVALLEKKIKAYYKHNLLYNKHGKSSAYVYFDKKTKKNVIKTKELEEAVNEKYNTEWSPGLMPLFPKDVNETLAKGKVITALGKMWKRGKQVKYDLDDLSDIDKIENIDGSQKSFNSNSVRSVFYNQFHDSEDNNYGGKLRMSMLGLDHKNGETVFIEKDATSLDKLKITQDNERFTDNIEVLLKWTVGDQIWQEQMENNALDIYNETKVRLRGIEIMQQIGQDMNNKAIEVYFSTTVNQQSLDKSDGVAGAANAALKLLSRSTIWAGTAINPTVGIVAASANTIQGITHAVASYVAGTKDKMSLKQQLEAKADVLKNRSKYKELGALLGLIEQDKTDLLSQQRYYKTKNSILNSRTPGYFGWKPDYETRLGLLSTIMHREGTAEAFVYDKETDSVTYKAKKDKRHFDENGKQTELQKAYMESLIYDLLEDDRYKVEQQAEIDLAKKENRQALPVFGYTFKDDRRFENLMESKIIGPYTKEKLPVGANTALHGFFTVFKKFTLNIAEQKLSGMGTLKKKGGIKKLEESVKVILTDDNGMPLYDDNGKPLIKWTALEEDGQWTTAVKQFLTVSKMIREGRFSDIKSFKNLTENQKYNLTRTGMDVVLIVLFFALRSGLRDLGDDLEKNRYTRAFKNGIFTSFEGAPWRVLNNVLSPAPFSYAQRLFKFVTFQANDYEKRGLIPGSGGLRTLEDLLDEITYADIDAL